MFKEFFGKWKYIISIGTGRNGVYDTSMSICERWNTVLGRIKLLEYFKLIFSRINGLTLQFLESSKQLK